MHDVFEMLPPVDTLPFITCLPHPAAACTIPSGVQTFQLLLGGIAPHTLQGGAPVPQGMRVCVRSQGRSLPATVRRGSRQAPARRASLEYVCSFDSHPSSPHTSSDVALDVDVDVSSVRPPALLILEVWQGHVVRSCMPALMLPQGQQALQQELLGLAASVEPSRQAGQESDPVASAAPGPSAAPTPHVMTVPTLTQDVAVELLGSLGYFLEHTSAHSGSGVSMAPGFVPHFLTSSTLDTSALAVGSWLLHCAVAHGCLSMSQLVLQELEGPSIGAGFEQLERCRSGHNGHTLLHLAVLSGKSYMVAQLIRWAAERRRPLSWRVEDSSGITPLHMAVMADPEGRMASMILARFETAQKAWSSAKGRIGVTPAQVAAALNMNIGVQGKCLSKRPGHLPGPDVREVQPPQRHATTTRQPSRLHITSKQPCPSSTDSESSDGNADGAGAAEEQAGDLPDSGDADNEQLLPRCAPKAATNVPADCTSAPRQMDHVQESQQREVQDQARAHAESANCSRSSYSQFARHPAATSLLPTVFLGFGAALEPSFSVYRHQVVLSLHVRWSQVMLGIVVAGLMSSIMRYGITMEVVGYMFWGSGFVVRACALPGASHLLDSSWGMLALALRLSTVGFMTLGVLPLNPQIFQAIHNQMFALGLLVSCACEMAPPRVCLLAALPTFFCFWKVYHRVGLSAPFTQSAVCVLMSVGVSLAIDLYLRDSFVRSMRKSRVMAKRF
eukprot:CAMPEP_0202907490 /NCGR_PEP_ID=MMETSP1392-20130828/42753_1 /ASSEMBLY_ACC=CAM_ASM_000868 /TAXON_ID=225041 /ORGANISM="Chlamydomonas chlamydogama, Strain SAG 11-48b" /LENGTH=728 /DNA_ID=CAMNT_0049596409 /DNA_START=1 /DNA_END=2187 /DNA_ORIENTATION=-